MFKAQKLNYADTHRFSKTVIDYLSAHKKIQAFYKYPVELASFKKIIADKKADQTNRSVLTQALHQQYKSIPTDTTTAQQQINLLKDENTFTVTTAHQINLFTGPLYVIFKIVSCINLTKTLKQQYPNYNFIPIFWLGSEDHDFEEVNHLNLFNKKVEWASKQKGATGKMPLNGIEGTISQVAQILGNSEEATFLVQQLQQAFQPNKTFGLASFHYLHQWFGDKGLLIIEADQPALKKLFVEEMKAELLQQAIYKNVTETNAQFGATYKVQAQPRAINLFYLKAGLRERIIKNESTQQYAINNTDIQFSKDDLLKELENHPERFSPNVLMRPLYQEKILPNLAYIGGGGELAYWLELLQTFKHFNINYPMLILRNSAQIIDKKTQTKWQSTGFKLAQLYQPFDVLSKTFIDKNEAININFTPHQSQLNQLKESLEQEALAVDASLKQSVAAEFAKMQKALQNVEQKMIRAAKRKSSEPLKQIENIQNKQLPNGGLPERYDNFMPSYLKWGDAFFEVLFQHFNCLEQQFLMLVEE